MASEKLTPHKLAHRDNVNISREGEGGGGWVSHPQTPPSMSGSSREVLVGGSETGSHKKSYKIYIFFFS